MILQQGSSQPFAVQLSHVWVEAAIDYFPSRGAKNIKADNWIPLDASFKQYEYLDGLDVATIGGIDAEQLVQDFEASGTSNEAEGWVQGFDASIIERAQQDAQKKLEAHIEKMKDPTVGDVIGGNKIIVEAYPVITATLPMQTIIRGADFAAIPDNQQVKIGLGLKTVQSVGIINIPSYDFDDEYNLTYYPLSQWNSEKSILRFTPSTDADRQALAALIPENATSIDDLPGSLPAYGIKVTPELVLNGTVMQRGDSMNLGREVQVMYKERMEGLRGGRPMMRYNVIAGSYLHIPIMGYSVNAFRLLDTLKKSESIQSVLEKGNQSEISALTRGDIMGNLVYTGGLGYFAQLHTMNRMLSEHSQSKGRTVIGYGSYGYEPKLRQGVLAIPQAILPGGMSTNMRVIDSSITVNELSIKFAMGATSSYLESAISEQLFCNKELNPNVKPCGGISTVSGLALAQQQGQKIYTITQQNKSQLKNVIMSSEEMSNEINQAINSGGVVMLPEHAVSGSGRDAIYVYYVQNPATGFTSWKISGGLNGGILSLLSDVSDTIQVIMYWH